MKRSDAITLDPLPSVADQLPRSRIVFRGQPTSALTDGFVLEAGISVGRLYLLFTTDDIPYEDTLHVQLYSAEWERLDHADIVWPYATGALRDLLLLPPDRVRFAFFAERYLTLRLLSSPQRGWSVMPRRGVWRPFGAYRHFEIDSD